MVGRPPHEPAAVMTPLNPHKRPIEPPVDPPPSGAKEAQAVTDEIAKLLREDPSIRSKLKRWPIRPRAAGSANRSQSSPLSSLQAQHRSSQWKSGSPQSPVTRPRRRHRRRRNLQQRLLGRVQQPERRVSSSWPHWAFEPWPHWAFELAKAALLSQQCSAAEALEAVTRSGGSGGSGGGPSSIFSGRPTHER